MLRVLTRVDQVRSERLASSLSSYMTVMVNEPSAGLHHVQQSVVEQCTPLVMQSKDDLLEMLTATREAADDLKQCHASVAKTNSEYVDRVSACTQRVEEVTSTLRKVLASYGRAEEQGQVSTETQVGGDTS